MSRKVVNIARSPRRAGTGPSADDWIRGAAARPLKRLTVEIDEALHRRLKVAATNRGCTMSVLVRDLIERDCPE